MQNEVPFGDPREILEFLVLGNAFSAISPEFVGIIKSLKYESGIRRTCSEMSPRSEIYRNRQILKPINMVFNDIFIIKSRRFARLAAVTRQPLDIFMTYNATIVKGFTISPNCLIAYASQISFGFLFFF